MGKGKVPFSGTGFLVGYARVSTDDQNIDLQLNALRREGVREDNLHVDYASGSSVKKRPGLILALKDLREGDTLVVWKLDRLTRYMPDLYWILAELERKGASLRSLTEHIDTSTASGRLGMNMATSFAQYERETIAERTKAGLAVIKEMRGAGWKWGPKAKMTPAKIKRAGVLLNEKNLSGPEVARRLKVKPPTIYHYWVRNPKWTKNSKPSVPRFILRER